MSFPWKPLISTNERKSNCRHLAANEKIAINQSWNSFVIRWRRVRLLVWLQSLISKLQAAQVAQRLVRKVLSKGSRLLRFLKKVTMFHTPSYSSVNDFTNYFTLLCNAHCLKHKMILDFFSVIFLVLPVFVIYYFEWCQVTFSVSVDPSMITYPWPTYAISLKQIILIDPIFFLFS